MATFRANNNAKAYAVPQSVTSTGDVSGQIITTYEEFPASLVAANGDVILCQVIPADQRVLSVRVVNNEDIATGVYTVGNSSNLDLGDSTQVEAAVAASFLPSSTLAAATAEHNMPTEGAAGFLKLFARPVFVTLTFTTAPTLKDGKLLKVIVQTIGK